MPRLRNVAAAVTALVVLLGAVGLVLGRGVPGRSRAVAVARATLQRLGFEPLGEATVSLLSDRLLGWALDRSGRAGGTTPAWGEGGAVRWRVVFAGGGEAVVTPNGTALSAHRPVPTATGEDLFPTVAQPRLEGALARIVDDPQAWTAIRRQSWREDDHLWHRARFQGGRGPLPSGWRREIEVEMVGSTVVGFRRRVNPLGTHLGVVAGRVRELSLLRIPAVVGLAFVVVAVLVAVAEGWAYHYRLAPVAGLATGGLVATAAAIGGAPVEVAPLLVVVAVVVVTASPLWTTPYVAHPRWGGAAGVAMASVLLQAPTVVAQAGGWIPFVPAAATQPQPIHLLAVAAVPALVEEPLLRGALPGLLASRVGWWGGALAGGALGALLHTVPAVPLVATVGVQLALQGGLVLLARWSGVTSAVLARWVCEVLLQRRAYPAGSAWDVTAMVAVGGVALYMLVPRRRE